MKIEDLITNWDKLVALKPALALNVDFCGTILPNEAHVLAGPNNRRFILRPYEHSNKYHDEPKKNEEEKESASKRENSDPIDGDCVIVSKKTKTTNKIEKHGNGNLTTVKQLTKTGQLTKDGKTVSVSVKSKSGKWNTTNDIRSLIDPQISLLTVNDCVLN